MAEGDKGKLTDMVVVGTTLGLIGYELYTLFNKRDGDTISETVWRASKRPLIPFSLGFLMGHFVWQRDEVNVKVEVKSGNDCSQ